MNALSRYKSAERFQKPPTKPSLTCLKFGHNDQKPAANISLLEYQANLQSLANEVTENGRYTGQYKNPAFLFSLIGSRSLSRLLPAADSSLNTITLTTSTTSGLQRLQLLRIQAQYSLI